MFSQKVWLRFVKKVSDGVVLKLKIQEIPPERIDEVIDLTVKYFLRDEPLSKALGIINNPNAVEEWLRYEKFRDPSSRFFVCCLDDGDKVETIMAVVVLQLKTNSEDTSLLETFKTEEIRKLATIFQEADSILDGKMKKPSAYCEPGIAVVFPSYRGLGLLRHLTTFILTFAEAHGVPATGSWFTAFGTQEAVKRAGFQTVCEIQYEDIAKKHSLAFTNAPTSMKYMMLMLGLSKL